MCMCDSVRVSVIYAKNVTGNMKCSKCVYSNEVSEN